MKIKPKALVFWRWLTTYKRVDYSKPWYRPEAMHGLPGMDGDLTPFHAQHDTDMKRMDLFANKPLLIGKLVGLLAPPALAILIPIVWHAVPDDDGLMAAAVLLCSWLSMLASVHLLVLCVRWETASVEVPLANSKLRVKILMELAERDMARAAKARNTDMTRGTKSLLVVKRSGFGEH